MSTTAPYGSWESPVGAADTVADIVRFSDLQYNEGTLYWLESRPSEGGRAVLVRRTDAGEIGDVLPDTANVRTMAHEYGGAPYRIESGDLVYSEFGDQRLYRVASDGSATPLTAEPPRPQSVRYADVARLSSGSLIAVRETHPAEGEAVNELVTIGADGTVDVIASGCDFYSTPRLSPDGAQLAWIEWDHPNMPWDGTRLVVADAAKHGRSEGDRRRRQRVDRATRVGTGRDPRLRLRSHWMVEPLSIQRFGNGAGARDGGGVRGPGVGLRRVVVRVPVRREDR